jgi:hypothetical protein
VPKIEMQKSDQASLDVPKDFQVYQRGTAKNRKDWRKFLAIDDDSPTTAPAKKGPWLCFWQSGGKTLDRQRDGCGGWK